MKILVIFALVSFMACAIVLLLGLAIAYRRGYFRVTRPANKLKARLLYICSYNPDSTPGINKARRHLLPKELAHLRANTLIKEFTFKNVIKYKSYQLKLKIYNAYEMANEIRKTKAANIKRALRKLKLQKAA